MLSIATHMEENGKVIPLDDQRRDAMLAMANDYNKDGFRVLVVATRDIPKAEAKDCTAPLDEHDLIIRGFLTFLDPPKESAGPAIAALMDIGVAVKVLTGDNAIVTTRICRQVGLEPGEPVLGPQIEALSDTALQQLVEERTVFAKLTPLQKSRVLKALQANGHTVGFLGDGINDAPALRDADVGISVDSGTDIAKESADIILLEKSLMVLEEGVIKGRETFGNIAQIPEHDRQLQLRQRVLGTGGQRVHSVPADARDPVAAAKPDVRHLPARAAVGQNGQRVPEQTAQVGCKETSAALWSGLARPRPFLT